MEINHTTADKNHGQPVALPTNRRAFAQRLSQGAAFGAAIWLTRGAFANELTPTPRLTEGPFYPDKLPLDTDNDLLILNDSLTPAVGEISHVSGRILSAAGEPIRNAFVEVWQCDNNGAYLHSGSGNADQRDSNFQGYGRFLTDAKGRYYFRTIKPVPYPGRTPHIHFAVSQKGQRVLTTQMLIEGNRQNESDGVFKQIKDAKLRKLLTAKFVPIEGSKLGELNVDFDLVIGKTPDEGADLKVHGLGQKTWNR